MSVKCVHQLGRQEDFLSRLRQGFKYNTIRESIIVFEEKRGDEETPSVTLATSGVLAGSPWERLGPLIPSGVRDCGQKAGRFAVEHRAGIWGSSRAEGRSVV